MILEIFRKKIIISRNVLFNKQLKNCAHVDQKVRVCVSDYDKLRGISRNPERFNDYVM